MDIGYFVACKICWVDLFHALRVLLIGLRDILSRRFHKSINYVINSTFRKIFDIKSQEVVDDCLEMFNCPPAEKTIAVRKCKFLTKFKLSSNILCRALADNAELELLSHVCLL